MGAGAGKLGKSPGAPIWEQGDWLKEVRDWEIQTPSIEDLILSQMSYYERIDFLLETHV